MKIAFLILYSPRERTQSGVSENVALGWAGLSNKTDVQKCPKVNDGDQLCYSHVKC